MANELIKRTRVRNGREEIDNITINGSAPIGQIFQDGGVVRVTVTRFHGDTTTYQKAN